jgi:hypothetical protein
MEKAGTPAATICTDAFVETSRSMATMWGAPSYPVIFTEHPIGSLTGEQLRERAETIVVQVVSVLTKGTVEQP